ncbi:MAG: adenylate/guanylate cyclase domain-containing protein [Acidimicrobiia bacterium]
MPVNRSPELEAVVSRYLSAYTEQGLEVLTNVVTGDECLRVLGFDADEWWQGPEDFLAVRRAQIAESPDFSATIHNVEAFADGDVGWFSVFYTLSGDEVLADIRSTGVCRLEGGVWKMVQWHNSVPVSNQQVFGTDLTTTLSDLVDSVLDDGGIIVTPADSEGTMTLVFTDIVDSTVIAESIGDSEWSRMISEHEATIRDITGASGGSVIKMLGDGSMLAFESARSSVRAAILLQAAVSSELFEMRIGIHTGEVMRTQTDLLGVTVNKAARIASATDSGAISISATTRDLIGTMNGVDIGEPRTIALKGLSGTHQLMTVAGVGGG